jgi:uncharacterized protein DUF2695
MAAVTLTTEHPAWDDFCSALYERLGGDVPGRCEDDHRHSRALLEQVGFDAETTLVYFEHRGGYCDCEVLINVDPSIVSVREEGDDGVAS